MAGQLMSAVMAGARNIIADITPDFEPSTTFYEASMRLPLERTPFSTPRQGTRAFHVVSGIMGGFGGPETGSFNAGELHHLGDVIVVRVRYHCPYSADGYGRLNNFVSTDAQRIYQALAYANEAAWGGEAGHPSTIDLIGSSQPVPVTDGEENEAWIVNMPFKIQTFLSE